MSDLVELLEPYKIIATVGLCKNAGKTTVLNYLLNEWASKKVIGITSIGYDGEASDGVTLLAKPRIFGQRGMVVATSQHCLDIFQGGYKVLETTNYMTALGQVTIVGITNPGEIEIAGPSVVSALGDICHRMVALGCQHVIADGAAGRMSYVTQVDAAVLSIGAAFSTEMAKVVNHSGYITELMALEKVQEPIELPDDCIFHKEIIEGIQYFCFRGIVADQDLHEILLKEIVENVFIVVKDSSALFVSQKLYERFRDQGGNIVVSQPMNLIAVTVNPMSPYGPWFPVDDFGVVIEERTGLPTFNVGPVSESHE